MELWLVSIPIEGHPFPEKESDYIQCGKVVFHQYIDPQSQNGKRYLASTIIEGELYSVVDKAINLMEDALTKLTFTSGLALKLNDSDYYLTPQTESEIFGLPKIGGSPGFVHRISKDFTFWYHIGKDDTMSILSKIDYLKPEKIELFDKALKHYRVAIGSMNPFQEIVSYFSAVNIITSDIRRKKKPNRTDLREVLKCVVDLTSRESRKDFNKAVDKYYGIDRTVATHGALDIDILDTTKIKETNTDAKNLKLWVRKLLIRYLDDNLQSQGAQKLGISMNP